MAAILPRMIAAQIRKGAKKSPPLLRALAALCELFLRLDVELEVDRISECRQELVVLLKLLLNALQHELARGLVGGSERLAELLLGGIIPLPQLDPLRFELDVLGGQSSLRRD